MHLAWPSPSLLPSYVDALRHGWTPDNERGPSAAEDELRQIEESPSRFLESLVDLEGRGNPVQLPDGSLVPRLPGFRQWMVDADGFCGSISLRWPPGSEPLPWYCLGHVGYSVVPWKQRQGYATRALGLVLPQARAQGLRQLEITADAGNLASQKVILANGGVLLGAEDKPVGFAGGKLLRFRIDL